MHVAEEGQHVVLAHGEELDVANLSDCLPAKPSEKNEISMPLLTESLLNKRGLTQIKYPLENGNEKRRQACRDL